jgi:hypothetical protein
VQRSGPVADRVGPFLLGADEREPQQLERRVLGREVPAGLDDLAELPVDGLDRVRRVDDLADVFGEREERREPLPVPSPRYDLKLWIGDPFEDATYLPR